MKTLDLTIDEVVSVIETGGDGVKITSRPNGEVIVTAPNWRAYRWTSGSPSLHVGDLSTISAMVDLSPCETKALTAALEGHAIEPKLAPSTCLCAGEPDAPVRQGWLSRLFGAKAA